MRGASPLRRILRAASSSATARDLIWSRSALTENGSTSRRERIASSRIAGTTPIHPPRPAGPSREPHERAGERVARPRPPATMRLVQPLLDVGTRPGGGEVFPRQRVLAAVVVAGARELEAEHLGEEAAAPVVAGRDDRL